MALHARKQQAPAHTNAHVHARAPTIGAVSPPPPLSLSTSSLAGTSEQWNHRYQHRHQHQRLQYRYFDNRRKTKRKGAKNPFKLLGVPEATLYKDVKKKFLKIAMTNHPDTHGVGLESVTDEERDAMRDIFINARIAFESLAEDPADGTAILKKDLQDAMENFDSWFQSETGHATPFPFDFDMDPETMKEVANMTETIGGGLDRDGGMWALARMVTSAVQSGGDAATMLRLEPGDVKEGRGRKLTGVSLRRRRKR
jgi:hypothetical protein